MHEKTQTPAGDSGGHDAVARSNATYDCDYTSQPGESQEPDMLTAALAYAERGWAVIPLHTIVDGCCSCRKVDCGSPGKHPHTSHGVKDASTDEKVIKGWWHRWPDANLGIACGPSKLVVIDIDERHGGRETWAELRSEYGINDETVTSLTGGGGEHLLFQSPADVEIRNSSGRLGPGVDVKADRGYIVAPPSVHLSGHRYHWEIGFHPDDRHPAPLLPQLRALLVEPHTQGELAPDPQGGERIAEGQRNSSLVSLGGSMRRRGMTESEILPALIAVNSDRCDPPLNQEDIERIAHSVARYQPASSGNLRLGGARSVSASPADIGADPDQAQPGSCAEPLPHEDLLELYEAALQAHTDDRSLRLQELASALLSSDPFTVEAFVSRAKEDDLCTKGAFKDALDEARRVLAPSDDDSESVSQSRPQLTTTEYIDLYLEWGYDVRLNLCTDDLEINGETLLDIVAAIIDTQVRDYGIVNNVRVSVRHAEEALIVMADRHRYHPVKTYLESLEWDRDQHIASLSAHFQDKDHVFDRWLLHFLVGSVAKIYDGFQNPMLVLDGPQNIGKSYFARWLGSPLPGYLHAGAISPESKDCRLRLNSTWIWEVEELGTTTRKSDVEALKAFLTLKTVRERKAYGRRDIVKPAIASFIGTVNNESGFLVDRTGNRRFLACTITKIDWTYSVAIDINQVWAEALHVYRTDDSWLLGDDEVKTRDALNEEYRVDDPIEAYVTSHFIFTGNYDDSVPLTQVLDKLSDVGIRPSQRVSIVIASVMRKGGAIKKRESHKGHRQPWYHGVKPGIWGT